MKSELDYKLIGENIKKYRNYKGMTQAELAELCDCSSNYIGVIERAEKAVGLVLLVTIAESLDVTVDQLLVGNYNKPEFAYLKEISERLESYSLNERVIACKSLLDLLDSLERFSSK